MADLFRLLQPQSVVYIGGSQIAGPIRAARRAGYQGELYVVNPRRDYIEGLQCYSSIDELPVTPDAAVVGLAAETSVIAVEELSRAGCGGAVVMSAGFAELNTDEGRERQQRLVDAAADMPLLGPNCMGLMNQFSGAFVWGDDNHCERQEGPAAAIISQSGALLIGMTGIETAFPLGYAVSVGNQSVTSIAELMEAILDDQRINAIGLYLEGLNEGDRLGQACVRALHCGVPVVALKGGDQLAGAAVALSHTASMVVERDLWNAFKRRFGVVEASSPKALVESLKLFTTAGVAKGNRLSVFSYSGGLNGLAAARCAELGLELPMPSTVNQQWLQQNLPDTVAIANPLDLNIPYTAPEGQISMKDTKGVAQAIVRFAEGVSDQIIFFIDVPRPGAGVLDKVWCDSLNALIDVKARLGVPVIIAGILPRGLPDNLCLHMHAHAVACLQGYSETMEALRLSMQFRVNRQCIVDRPAPLLKSHPVRTTRLLDEAQSKQALGTYGLPLAKFAVATPSEVCTVAQEVGYPVALKILSNQLAHKASIGGVKLNITQDSMLKQELAALTDNISACGLSVEQVLIEQMVTGADTEVIIGVKRHAALGFAMMVGKGGSEVEANAEFETLLLPCTDAEISRVLKTLKLHDHPATAQLQEACNAVAAYTCDNQDVLSSLDVNPVILTSEGEAIATDALIVQAIK